MKRIMVTTFSAIMVLLAVACPPTEEPKEVVKNYTIEQFLKTISIGGSSFSADESKLLVSSNETGVFNVYSIDIATGERTAITDSKETTVAVAYFPEDDRILFTRDKGGNEINHLFVRDPEGDVTEITEGENTKESFAGFAYDFKSFFTVNNSRDPRFMDAYEYDVNTYEKKMIYQNEHGLFPGGISNDKRWMVFVKPNTTNDSNIYLLDLQAGGEPQLISEHEGEATFSPSSFSTDSRYLYYTTNAEGEFRILERYDLESGAHEEVFKVDDWDVVAAYFSREGTYRVIATNEDGFFKITIANMKTGEEVPRPEGIPEGQIGGISFSRSERLMKFSITGDTMPSNTFVFNFETGDVKQLTDTLNPEIDPADLVACEVVRFKARDGLEIPCLLYKPKGASRDNKVPALLNIHGGPGGQSLPLYRAETQFLINHGYAIFEVNNRGSSGYGKTFLAADDQRHGREPLWDCVDAKEYLKTLDWIDPDKIGIMGGSYGGYMVLAALAFTPDEFKVGVDIFGVANWVRTLKGIPAWWEAQRNALYKELGDPETQEEMLRAISPVFHADKITKPLIILQGARDPRVIKAESEDMVKAIEDKGGTVEYIIFDDEGHGFTKNENRIEGFNAVLKFLDKYLKGEGEKSSE